MSGNRLSLAIKFAGATIEEVEEEVLETKLLEEESEDDWGKEETETLNDEVETDDRETNELDTDEYGIEETDSPTELITELELSGEEGMAGSSFLWQAESKMAKNRIDTNFFIETP